MTTDPEDTRPWRSFPYGRAHHCLTDPDAEFPSGMPDVDADGLAAGGRTPNGPITHDCATCGERYVWAETCGFVVWQPEASWDAVYDRLRATPPSPGEAARHGSRS